MNSKWIESKSKGPIINFQMILAPRPVAMIQVTLVQIAVIRLRFRISISCRCLMFSQLACSGFKTSKSKTTNLAASKKKLTRKISKRF